MTQSGLSWRWPLWVAMIYSGVCLLLLYFFIPETYGPVLLQRKARELRKVDPLGNKDVYAEHERGDWSLRGVVRRTVVRPIKMVRREKILVFLTIYLSFVYGVLYSRKNFRTSHTNVSAESSSVVFEALPVVFVAKRNFSVSHLGLIYAGTFCTSVGRPDLILFRSCRCRYSSRRDNLCLALKGYRRAREEMGGFPTTRAPTIRCYSRWPPSDDRVFLARLDRRV